MRIPLKTRFSLFLVLSTLSITVVSTLLFAWFFRTAAEEQLVARGVALGQSLARAASEGLAAEDLDLLGKAADIVRAEDLLFVQVFSSIWSPIDAYPFEEMRRPPAPEAIEHFRQNSTPLSRKEHGGFEFYVPIRFQIPQAPETTIGFARLALSAGQIRTSLLSIVLASLLIGAVLGLTFVAVAHIVVGRTVVAPILDLHDAVARWREGQTPGLGPSTADDEIGDLARAFHGLSIALREREQRLSDEKERLAVTLRSIGDGVIVADTDGLIVLLNRVAEELTGWTSEQAAGRSFCEVFATRHAQTREPCANIVAAVLSTDSIVSLPGNTVLVRQDGSELQIEDSAAPIHDRESRIIGIVLAFRDITEKRRLEGELVRSEKLLAIGVLAGGIAHDFNNLLTGILGNISLARGDLAPGLRAQERLDQAEAAARRASDLTQQLLTFSRGGEPVRRAADIVTIIKESARFVLSGSSTKAVFACGQGIWPVEVDAGQMSQVFNNLSLNAVQAMRPGGTVTYAVQNTSLGAGELSALPGGDYVLIAVHDEGAGISAEHLGRIFDPYFTTKPDGTGLGLASAHSIVQRHGGHISVESAPSRGTTFRIWLPAARGAAPAAIAREQEPYPAGHGRVLVMDDEALVREVASEILRSIGYEPVTATGGEQALELYRQALEEGRPFRAVVMDLTIPGGVGGKEAITRLLALDPGARAIVSSGYSNDPVMANYRSHGFRAVAVKPYNVKDFARALLEVLEGP